MLTYIPLPHWRGNHVNCCAATPTYHLLSCAPPMAPPTVSVVTMAPFMFHFPPSSGNHGQLLCCHAHLRLSCLLHSKREGEPTPSRSSALYLPQCGRGWTQGERRWWSLDPGQPTTGVDDPI